MTDLTTHGDNSCWPVRTLRLEDGDGWWRERSPVMAAGPSDHLWI